MKQNTYFFARAFIRLAIGLAILVCIIGLLLAAQRLFLTISQVEQARHRPDKGLENIAHQLIQSYSDTQQRLVHTLRATEFPASVKIFGHEAFVLQSSDNRASNPETYIELAADIRESVDSMKEHHKSELVKSVQGLRQTLLEHASRIKGEVTNNTPQPTTPADSLPPRSSSDITSSTRLFADSPSTDHQRLEVINEFREIFKALRAQSKRPDSVDQIQRATDYLKMAETMLDLMVDTGPELSDSGETPSIPDEELLVRAERIAQVLSLLLNQIDLALYSEWSVDTAIGNMVTAASEEAAAITDSKAQRISLWLEGIGDIARQIFVALALAFAVMVLADFLRAFLNLSNNSDVLTNSALNQES